MATTWIQLLAPVFGSPAGTVMAIDSADARLPQLLNANLAIPATDPGGTPATPPAVNPGGDLTTDAELAAALAAQKATFESRTPTVSIARNAAGRISSVTQDGVTESYTRDAAGRVATLTVGGVTRIVTRTPAGAVSGVA